MDSRVSGIRFDEAVAFQQERTGGFKIELPFDRDEWEYRVRCKRQHAHKQAPGYADCKIQVLRVTDALLVWMLCEYGHFSLPLSAPLSFAVGAMNDGE
jgi:hypothetical protein